MLGNKTTISVNRHATIEDVMRLIMATAAKEANSVSITRLLQHVPYTPGNDMAFLESMFLHIKRTTRYKNDQEGKEQIKTPDRFLMKDGFGDCDDFAVTWGALLTRLGKQFHYKIVKYRKDGGWAHIYVIVPMLSGTVVLDSVLGQFNKEVDHVSEQVF